jgi:ferredoxin
MPISDPTAWLSDVVRRFLDTAPENTLAMDTGEPAWDSFLLGLARGDDPLFAFYKQDIGDFYWTPLEVFSQAFPGLDAAPADLAVISWILPQTKAVRRDNRRGGALTSERWARSKLFGERCNDALRAHVAQSLAEAGHPAVAPMRSPLWDRRTSPKYGFASNWSERHTAYACGLGTFGLSDGLITARGKAHRAGSVVALLKVEPARRPYDDHHAYCLHYNGGACLKCAERCPAGAISERGHDKERCKAYYRGELLTRHLESMELGAPVVACGLCQVGVPCESRIPVRGMRPGK